MGNQETTGSAPGSWPSWGGPTSGKSTLLNRLLGSHVAIVSARPQTTRTRILGVYNAPGLQLALFDTPGLHRAKGPLNRRMVDTALGTLSEVDAALVLVEAGTGPDLRVEVGETARWIVEEVRKSKKPVVLGINKADRVPRETLLPVIEAYRGLHDWAAVVPFSALTGENVERLVGALAGCLPEAEAPLFPVDVLTDQAERGSRGRVRARAGDGADPGRGPLRGGGRGRGVRRV